MNQINKETELKKMRDLTIFKNKIILNDGIVLHQDDMPGYSSWLLVEYHDVDKVLYRGASEKAWQVNPSIPNLIDGIDKIGNPKNIIITSSKKDTY